MTLASGVMAKIADLIGGTYPLTLVVRRATDFYAEISELKSADNERLRLSSGQLQPQHEDDYSI